MLSPSFTSTVASPRTITISLKITSGKERRIFAGAGAAFDGTGLLAVSKAGPDERAALAATGTVPQLCSAAPGAGANCTVGGGTAGTAIIRGAIIGRIYC